jgi:heme exporter protein D
MSHWTYVAAAYAVTLLATAALLLRSWVSMRRAEAAAEQLRRDR